MRFLFTRAQNTDSLWFICCCCRSFVFSGYLARCSEFLRWLCSVISIVLVLFLPFFCCSLHCQFNLNSTFITIYWYLAPAHIVLCVHDVHFSLLNALFKSCCVSLKCCCCSHINIFYFVGSFRFPVFFCSLLHPLLILHKPNWDKPYTTNLTIYFQLLYAVHIDYCLVQTEFFSNFRQQHI